MKIFLGGWEKNPTPFSATDTHLLLVTRTIHDISFFQMGCNAEWYNIPYERQKQLGHIFSLFLQNTKHNTIVDNFGINDRIEITGDEIKLFNAHGYCGSR